MQTLRSSIAASALTVPTLAYSHSDNWEQNELNSRRLRRIRAGGKPSEYCHNTVESKDYDGLQTVYGRSSTCTDVLSYYKYYILSNARHSATI